MSFLSLSEAISKMSLMPAQTLEAFIPQMRAKGRLQVGMDADIVVFDPKTVAINQPLSLVASRKGQLQTGLFSGLRHMI